MEPAHKPATYADLLSLPEDVKAEIVAGQVITAPSPLPEHSRAADAINRVIGGAFDLNHGRGGPGGWWIISEVDVQLSVHNIVRPDLSGWKRDRLPEPWGMRPIAVIPDWVCEVLSPSNAAYDRVTKATLYANHGVKFLWLVDPLQRVLEAFRLADGLWTRIASHDDTGIGRIPPFEDAELDLSLLFPPPTTQP